MAAVALYREQMPMSWFKICPDFYKLQSDVFATNVTRAQVQASMLGCLTIRVTELIVIYFNLMVYSLIVLGTFGLIGSALILITLTTTKSVYFQSPTYRYFRLLIAVQTFLMVGLIHASIRQMLINPDAKTYGWFFVTLYIEPIFTYVFSTWADCLICYLSIERSVACLIPGRFYLLNGKRCFAIVTVVTLLAACIGELPPIAVTTIGFNNLTKVYEKGWAVSSSGKTVVEYFRTAWATVKCVALIVSTTVAIYGFYAAYRRKIRLQRKASNDTARATYQEWKVTRQLCTLQLAQAIPTIFSSLMFTFSRFAFFSSPLDIDPKNLTYATEFQISYSLTYLNLSYFFICFFVITSFFGHCSHFYLYFVCSRPFRVATWEALKCGQIMFCLKWSPTTSSVQVHPAGGGGSRSQGARSDGVSGNFVSSNQGTNGTVRTNLPPLPYQLQTHNQSTNGQSFLVILPAVQS